MSLPAELIPFLASVHPYDSLPAKALGALAAACERCDAATGETVFACGAAVPGLFVIVSGTVEITDQSGIQLSILGPRNSFGERALLRRETASRTARASEPTVMILVPEAQFHALIAEHAPVARFFDRRRPAPVGGQSLHTLPVGHLMSRAPETCPPATPIRDAAARMRRAHISSICVADEAGFHGIVTLRDMNGRVIVDGVDPTDPVSRIMTAAPLTLGPRALVTDVLHLMVEQRIGHIPIVEDGRLLGIVTQTDLTRAQALSSAEIVERVARAATPDEMARATADIPRLLVQLVDTGNRHETVTRLITDIADTATRRLLALAEAELGPAPASYLWLACGSQGRQEQTGVSDQDNCLILDDSVSEADRPYFATLARFVSDGLDRCGYVFCPGDMMATNPRWCQPLATWRGYFDAWIARPSPEAQMLASVMFDLRPIGGEMRLFDQLQEETLRKASANSIFAAHMISNALKHHPPLGLLRGLATIRSGEHRNALDLKHNGVVPVVDLGRAYALQGQLRSVNTRARLEAAMAAGVLSGSGGSDLLSAYDLIATTRLRHQAAQIRAGQRPGNFLNPADLSDFERSHLRDAFVVVKTMQSALGSGKATLG
ncbi:DUF294 nucleotidyltransferase-like domain-containing protein [Poseidonocella sedimentorum]|uniref:CBS domain-containing protein n=1 Tax=Poseidonocella sedimentorum TaxID=871652 RepID=A0A1I6EJL1_9RHOB|nr:DUF294 nucleotidyltransferase-like domain-containing protein [Poseidonocella sedimentorum]SFR17837.1 CBS domain-containing protein [Poseidonocella sedimentorum]